MREPRHKALGEPEEPADGTRILITRYRPRHVRKGEESWSEWNQRLAPSVALLDASFGKKREGRRVVARDLEPIPWEEFERRFREELDAPDAQAALEGLRRRAAAGEPITILCSCRDASRCHRSIVHGLLI